jgi:hypothetical protein
VAAAAAAVGRSHGETPRASLNRLGFAESTDTYNL